MREIKFRAWDKDLKSWLHRAHPSYWGINFIIDSQCDIMTLPKDSAIIISQFTGLLDKNGKEIFEGDLVKHPMLSKPTEVKWLNVGWTPFMSYHAGEDYKVIGNIWENPELITT